MDHSSYTETVLDLFRPHLHTYITSMVNAGKTLPEPGLLADMLAAKAGDTVQTRMSKTGPFYTAEQVMELLDITNVATLTDRHRRGTLLEIRTAGGETLYPTYQFDNNTRRLRAGLSPILAALKTVNSTDAALWLTTEHDQLGGHTPLDAAGQHHTLVLQLAEQYANSTPS